MKSQGTSKAGEMDWEERLEDLFGIAYDDLPGGIIGITPTVPEIKDFIRKAINQAIAQERERILCSIGLDLNQKCVIFIDNHNFVNRKCVDCGLVIDEKTSKKIEAKNIITNNHE